MTGSDKRDLLPITANILFLTFALITQAVGQAQPRTITDFYLALPTSFNVVKNLDETPFREGFFFDEFYENEATTSRAAILRHRRSLIEIEDVANGYLKLKPKRSEGWEEVALFRKANGAYLIALSQVGCGPGCFGDLMLLAYNSGTWTNVTKQVFPSRPSLDRGYFELPRIGTSIELIYSDEGNQSCQSGLRSVKFRWSKHSFVKKQGSRVVPSKRT